MTTESISNYIEDEINNMTPYNKRKFYLFEKIILCFVHTYNLYLYIPIIVILASVGFYIGLTLYIKYNKWKTERILNSLLYNK